MQRRMPGEYRPSQPAVVHVLKEEPPVINVVVPEPQRDHWERFAIVVSTIATIIAAIALIISVDQAKTASQQANLMSKQLVSADRNRHLEAVFKATVELCSAAEFYIDASKRDDFSELVIQSFEKALSDKAIVANRESEMLNFWLSPAQRDVLDQLDRDRERAARPLDGDYVSEKHCGNFGQVLQSFQ